MIQITETIVQDQLIASSIPGRVRAVYPRGSQTVLEVNTDAPIPIATICPNDEAHDGVYQGAIVLATGNLLYLSDRPGSVGYLVVGANLQPLGQ